MSKAFTVYGRPGCGFCVRARHLLELKKLPHRYVDIYEQNMTKSDLAEIVGRPVLTVPQILHGEDYVGGCSELEDYLDSLDAA